MDPRPAIPAAAEIAHETQPAVSWDAVFAGAAAALAMLVVLTTLAAGFGMLAVSRLLLGAGEGGGFPAATRAVANPFCTAFRR